MLQGRPRTPSLEQRHPYYSPNRDLGHAGPWLVETAVRCIDDAFSQDWYVPLRDATGITWDDVLDGVHKFADAMALILSKESPQYWEALEKSGFSKVNTAVQLLIFVQLGKVFLGAMWVGVRDVNAPEGTPPVPIRDMVSMVECILAKEQPSVTAVVPKTVVPVELGTGTKNG